MIATIFSMILGVIISNACLLVSQVIIPYDKQFYHKEKSSLDRVLHFFIFLVSVSCLVFFNLSQINILSFIKGVLVIIIMGLIAYTDSKLGRIPFHFLVVSLISGIFLGVLTGGIASYLIGGFVNLAFGVSIFLLGRVYLRRKKDQSTSFSAIGFGDVYALGSLGFLHGFSQGFAALTLAFLFSALGAAVIALIKKKDFLAIQLRLGPYFFFAAAFVTLFTLYSR